MQRIFTLDDQLWFAALSGDYNPMHVDPVAARRFMFGKPVVHGVHALLWALDCHLQSASDSTRLAINKLLVDFRAPILVDQTVDLKITPGPVVLLELHHGSVVHTTIELQLSAARAAADPSPDDPPKQPCREISPDSIAHRQGDLPLHLHVAAAQKLFEHLVLKLEHGQIAALLASTRLVGMELPGLHSLYTGLELHADSAADHSTLQYQVINYDPRFPMAVSLAVQAPGLSGKIAASFRPTPSRQASVEDIRPFVTSDEFSHERALVIGGSRGLGEVAVKALAIGGAQVRFTYFKGQSDAERILAELPPGSAQCLAFDVNKHGQTLQQNLRDFHPTLLCYFATPVISSPAAGQFSAARFEDFTRCYIDGFLSVLDVFPEVQRVLYPSSTAIDELPPNMIEYAAAKTAGETMCAALVKSRPRLRIEWPRYPRMATDQTASLITVDTANAITVVLDSLRSLEKPASAIARQQPVPLSAPVEVALTGPPLVIAATFTAEPLESALAFWLRQLHQPSPVEFAQFNQIFQLMLDPAGLFSRKNLANVVLIRLEDWIENRGDWPDADQCKARLDPLVDEFLSAARAMVRPSPTLVIVCPASTVVIIDPARAKVLADLEAKMLSGLVGAPGIYAFGPDAIASLYPVADFYDAGADAIGKIPYTAEYFAALGTFINRMALAARRPPFKVIVLDCDNTLWSGVCGEGGVAAVSVPAGFAAMQQFMLRQSAQGKVLCLASKNVESDAFDIFDQHAGMVLKRNHFAAHRINWSPKSQNLRELSKELNLGLDSFIFLDDNPVECAEVRTNCPQVLTIQAPANGEDWPLLLEHIWAFDQLSVTEQDRQRAASYLQNAQRETIRKQSAGLDDFLSKLELKIDISPATPATMARVAQLTERTNQFNFTTRRRGETELISLLKDSRYQCDTVEVSDRFGHYGLVGVMISEQTADAVAVDTFLLSCRVLGRGVEHRMLATLGARARSAGLPAVNVSLIRTKKNQPALDFLTSAIGAFATPTGDGVQYIVPTDFAANVKATVASAPPVEESSKAGMAAAPPETTAVPYEAIAKQFSDVTSILKAIEAAPAVVAVEPASESTDGRPQNPTQQKLVEIWSAILKRADIGIHDDYFSVGGTSLLAVRLVLDVEKAFGVHLPIATLLKASTVAKLSQLVSAPDIKSIFDDSVVVEFKSTGTGPALLLLPGIGGHVLSYKRVIDLLKFNGPIYGLEMRPEIESNRRPRSLQTMAAELLPHVLQIQPKGPYLLAGWSFGGILAFELARQLREKNQAVAMVAMFDTWRHVHPPAMPLSSRLGAHAHRLAHRGLTGNLAYVAVTGRVQIKLLQHRLMKLAGLRQSDFHMYESSDLEKMVAVCDAAWRDYAPQKSPVAIDLFKATQNPDLVGVDYSDATNGFADLVDEIRVHQVETNHLGFFEPAIAPRTAEILDRCLKRALA